MGHLSKGSISKPPSSPINPPLRIRTVDSDQNDPTVLSIICPYAGKYLIEGKVIGLGLFIGVVSDSNAIVTNGVGNAFYIHRVFSFRNATKQRSSPDSDLFHSTGGLWVM